MAELAAHLGATAAELAVPMSKLKRSGRVRRVGARQFTRYFPQVLASASEIEDDAVGWGCRSNSEIFSAKRLASEPELVDGAALLQRVDNEVAFSCGQR